jgi:hypothetical protein
VPLVCGGFVLGSGPVGLPAVLSWLLFVGRGNIVHHLHRRQVLGQRRIDHLCDVHRWVRGHSGSVAVQSVRRWHVRDCRFGDLYELHNGLLFTGSCESVHSLRGRHIRSADRAGNMYSVSLGHLHINDRKILLYRLSRGHIFVYQYDNMHGMCSRYILADRIQLLYLVFPRHIHTLIRAERMCKLRCRYIHKYVWTHELHDLCGRFLRRIVGNEHLRTVLRGILRCVSGVISLYTVPGR